MTEDERHDLGLATRRRILGDSWVDASLAATTEDDRDFQALLTRWAWGDIWTRPGLPSETRRLLVLAMMVALNREHEFKLHARAALEGGVPREAVREAVLQTAIYCGIPAALSAFRWLKDVVAELSLKGEDPGGR
jgi:4-carboxymuconolactone decarboxylase